jgi:[pyruvate, water dikinase]-phosphate phosphotransferase / [pyruvate, water dikinase] kinase
LSDLVHSPHPVCQQAKPVTHRHESYFHLHLVSDATGETLMTVGRAAAVQYATVSAIEHVYPLVR